MIDSIVQQIDEEIAKLENAKRILIGKPQPIPAVTTKAKRKKRNLTPEGRARIAEAVKRRWSQQKAA